MAEVLPPFLFFFSTTTGTTAIVTIIARTQIKPITSIERVNCDLLVFSFLLREEAMILEGHSSSTATPDDLIGMVVAVEGYMYR